MGKCLGRKALVTDSRTLRLSRYLTAALPAPPDRVDWSKGITSFGEMLNDQLGDCTIAGLGHAIQVWSANTGSEVTLPDCFIQSAYEQWCGYDPNDPSTDEGGIELDVLKNFRQNGLGGHKLIAFADASPINTTEVKQAINLFGGLYIGVGLPLTAQGQSVWDVVNSGNTDSYPGSWGGHCVYVPKYDDTGLTCITWGSLVPMTWAFWNRYVDEAHALIGSDWFNAGNIDPQGIDLAQLQADLAAIR
jgi:hypothetical protein